MQLNRLCQDLPKNRKTPLFSSLLADLAWPVLVLAGSFNSNLADCRILELFCREYLGRQIRFRDLLSCMISGMSDTGGPYLVNAFFCQKVLFEKDGVPSYIRVVDRWTITGPAAEMPISVINTYIVVSFKSGMFRGPIELTITPRTPSQKELPAIVSPLLFEGDDDRGCGVSGEIGFPVSEPGVYWFEVKLGDTIITMMSLRVIYLRVG